MRQKIGIVWFRLDLRITDNEALYDAMRIEDEVIPVYIFDERNFGYRTNGLPKYSPYQTQFIIESVSQLRHQLRSLGTDLIVRVGKPEEILFDLARQYKTNSVFCNRERTRDEMCVQESLEENLWSIGQELRFSRGKMLYYTQDLPFPITQTPDQFSIFRKEVDKIVQVRPQLKIELNQNKSYSIEIEPGEIPTLEELGIMADIESGFAGGELNALSRMDQVEQELNSGQKTKLRISPWLSCGCISPKTIYHRLESSASGSSKGVAKELFRNLMLRDFHRLMGKKHKSKLFNMTGLVEHVSLQESRLDKNAFRAWLLGETKQSFVNACMRELALTGFLPHQYRRLVASYLINELEQPWISGARYFQSILIDYDPMSNYGNWQRAAHLHLDQKGETEIIIDNMERRFDPDGKYQEKWLNQQPPDFLYKYH